VLSECLIPYVANSFSSAYERMQRVDMAHNSVKQKLAETVQMHLTLLRREEYESLTAEYRGP
jgi:hypothetical protein